MRALVLAASLLAAGPVAAEVPGWMSGAWATNARLTAPDGARLRIRCSLDAASEGTTWSGVLGCATVQGRFEGRWTVAISGGSAAGQVQFTGPSEDLLQVSGDAAADAVALASGDGQSVRFSPGADGALVVEMNALGPQRLTGALTFEAR
ncbi:hypothetical protein V8J82_16150 [Gymnodinialimonas sp. 2305UL16-5]|uniref:hypothetical protein n=1 Tax=Gymnodinialimonas mytili TaxID=3126503 RepID=UPI0030B03E43